MNKTDTEAMSHLRSSGEKQLVNWKDILYSVRE